MLEPDNRTQPELECRPFEPDTQIWPAGVSVLFSPFERRTALDPYHLVIHFLLHGCPVPPWLRPLRFSADLDAIDVAAASGAVQRRLSSSIREVHLFGENYCCQSST